MSETGQAHVRGRKLWITRVYLLRPPEARIYRTVRPCVAFHPGFNTYSPSSLEYPVLPRGISFVYLLYSSAAPLHLCNSSWSLRNEPQTRSHPSSLLLILHFFVFSRMRVENSQGPVWQQGKREEKPRLGAVLFVERCSYA